MHKDPKNNFTDIEELIFFLQISKVKQKKIFKETLFPLNLPRRIAEKIKKNDLKNPLFKQFVPMQEETFLKKGFCISPVKDNLFQEGNLIQKYQNRALLICSDTCAMHCRFCFRKNFAYTISDFTFKKELELIKKRTNLTEIILSGGDPLCLENKTLQNLLVELDKIEHVKRIRIHTRALIAFPQRIDNPLLKIFSSIKKQIILVIHINHPNELDQEIIEKIKKIQALKIPILSQSVLLKGINDQVPILLKLFETLSNCGVIPYYLHQLDKVKGAAHFEVNIKKGLNLIQNLRKITSGYNIPLYVQEIPHKKSKTVLNFLKSHC